MGKDLFDHKSFEKLFETHFTNLTRFVYNYVKNEDVAKDIVHDAFLTLWNNRMKLDPAKSIKSYLFTISQNYALNYLRHLKVEIANEQQIAEIITSAEEEWDMYEERLNRLENKLKKLSDKQRAVLEKCIIEGRTYKDTAEEMGISQNTVKTHITRALKFLRSELQDDICLALFTCFQKLNNTVNHQ